eukprot:353033-Chlamydomonas_euryale.AAC.8
MSSDLRRARCPRTCFCVALVAPGTGGPFAISGLASRFRSVPARSTTKPSLLASNQLPSSTTWTALRASAREQCRRSHFYENATQVHTRLGVKDCDATVRQFGRARRPRMRCAANASILDGRPHARRDTRKTAGASAAALAVLVAATACQAAYIPEPRGA